MNWLQKNIWRAHYEAQKARYNDEARDYTKKDETSDPEHPWKEVGEFNQGRTKKNPEFGKRNDLADFTEAIRSGKNQRDLVEAGYTGELARYPKFYSTIRSIYMPERGEVKVSLYFGEPGTGKTLKAITDNRDDLYVVPVTNNIWFDGYDGQEVALLDDFCGKYSKVRLDYTLRLLDRYSVQVPIKGGFTWWTPKNVIVTTNIHPFNWYDFTNRKKHWKALARRFHEVLVFEKDKEPYEVDPAEFLEDDEIIMDTGFHTRDQF